MNEDNSYAFLIVCFGLAFLALCFVGVGECIGTRKVHKEAVEKGVARFVAVGPNKTKFEWILPENRETEK